jgi:hypothetical protein
METVLPGGHAVLPVNARGLAAGSFSGTANHPADGVFVALPSQTIPPWAIALFIVGGLILAAMLILLIRTRRKATTS